jgi:23S rRNA pseudouridine2605 synthase
LTEGKNREIRNICGHFGWPVSRLIRVAYGPFQLGSHLQPGDIEEVPAKVLREQLGEKKVHQVSGQLKLKNAPTKERPAAERPRADKTRGEKPRADQKRPDRPRGEKKRDDQKRDDQLGRRHKPRPKPGRHAH